MDVAKVQDKQAFLLDTAATKGLIIVQLTAREYQALHVRRDALLVLDLFLDLPCRVRRLALDRDATG